MIVYVGNMLSKHGKSINFIESLTFKLKSKYKIVAVSSKRNKFIRLLEMLLTVIRHKNKCKVVLLDTYSTTAFLYAYFVAKLCYIFRIPYVPILHGGNLPNRYKRDKTRLDWFLSNAAQIVSPSIYLDEFFSKNGYVIRYIPNFIEISNYNFVNRSNLLPNLLWVRSFQSIYNPLLAIELMRHLRNRIPNAKLCMVGGGDEDILTQVKEKIKEYNLEASIKITGPLPKIEWIGLSSQYDIFINTTNVDNMPVSVIEAMALGLVVVSTNVGGIPYLIENGHRGILVEKNNHEDFTTKILELLNSPMVVSSLQKNARRYVEDFDWKVIQQRWTELLDPYLV